MKNVLKVVLLMFVLASASSLGAMEKADTVRSDSPQYNDRNSGANTPVPASSALISYMKQATIYLKMDIYSYVSCIPSRPRRGMVYHKQMRIYPRFHLTRDQVVEKLNKLLEADQVAEVISLSLAVAELSYNKVYGRELKDILSTLDSFLSVAQRDSRAGLIYEEFKKTFNERNERNERRRKRRSSSFVLYITGE